MRVEVRPEMLQWARERAGFELGKLARRIPQLRAWERGEKQPTLKQLEGFAKATHTPVGYLFLTEPPVERVPIPDFRTVANQRIQRPSSDLLDTLYICQQRQEWYREFAKSMGERPLAFVGSVRVGDDVVQTAVRIRHTLSFDIDARREMPTLLSRLPPLRSRDSALLRLIGEVVAYGGIRGRRISPVPVSRKELDREQAGAEA